MSAKSKFMTTLVGWIESRAEIENLSHVGAASYLGTRCSQLSPNF
jgi:hypothetical protein